MFSVFCRRSFKLPLSLPLVLVRDRKDRTVPRRSSNSSVAARAPQFFAPAEWSLPQQRAPVDKGPLAGVTSRSHLHLRNQSVAIMRGNLQQSLPSSGVNPEVAD